MIWASILAGLALLCLLAFRIGVRVGQRRSSLRWGNELRNQREKYDALMDALKKDRNAGWAEAAKWSTEAHQQADRDAEQMITLRRKLARAERMLKHESEKPQEPISWRG